MRGQGRRVRFWDSLKQDVRFSLRQWARKPGFSGIVIVTLALGIGGNVAVFSVFKAVLLEPLPYPESDRLVRVWKSRVGTYEQSPLSDLNYLDLREHNTVFEELGVYEYKWANLSGDFAPERIRGVVCSSSFLRLLGIAPEMGRLFTDEEQSSGVKVVLLSHSTWRTRLGADPEIVGRRITLDRERYTVIGVMPEGYELSLPWIPASRPELWMPVTLSTERGRGWNWLSAVGRLRKGLSGDVATAELESTAAGLAELDSYYRQRRFVVSPLRNMVSWVGPTLWILLGAVGLLLLIVCANIASMLLARCAHRQTEIAVRSSLGAGRGRLARQLLTESLLLSLPGGATGVLLAWWGVGLLRSVMPLEVPRILETRVDVWVLAFALAVTVVAATLSGLIPALTAVRFDIMGVLREGRGGTTVGLRRMRTHNLLLVGQFGLALVVANAAGLMLRSLYNVVNEPIHFDAENVLTAGITLQGSGYESAAAKKIFWDRLLERARLIPGVESVSLTTRLPLEGGSSASFIVAGEEYDPEAQRPYIEMKDATSDYFWTLGIPIIYGRSVREEQTAGSFEIVVNRALAERHWPDESPIGKHIYSNTPTPEWTATVVGVAENVRQYGLEYPVGPEIYFPFGLMSHSNSILVLRTSVGPETVVRALQEAVAELDPHLPLSRIRTMDEVIGASTAERRFSTLLILLFAVVALVLVGVGIYGVMSYYVAGRTQELGIRMALGAEKHRVLEMVVRRGLHSALLGVGLGVVMAAASVASIRHMLFGVSPFDPLITIGVALFIVFVALLGSIVPALRAVQIDPLSALRVQ